MSSAQRLWRLLDSGQRWRFVGLQGMCVVMAFSTLIGLAAIIPFFAVLGDPQEVFRRDALARLYDLGGFTSDYSFVVALGVAFITLIVLANAVNMLGTAMLNSFAFAVGDSFRADLFKHYLSRGTLFHTSHNSAALLNNLIYEVDRITALLQSLFSLTANAISAFFIVIAAAFIDLRLTAFAVAFLAGSYLVVYALTRRRLIRNGVMQTRFSAERATTAAEALAAIKELTIWGGQRQFLDRFSAACRILTRATSSSQNVGQQPRYLFECVAVAGLVTIALVLRADEARIGAWLSQLTFLGFATYRLLPSLQQVFHSVVRMRANLPALERAEADLAAARSIEREPQCEPLVPFAHTISLTDVSFSYGNGRAHALRNVSLEILRGSMIAIVGANGSGKTTLVDLLLGLLSPESGKVAIDGSFLAPRRCRAWQSQIAYVPQHIALLDASLAENIAFAASNASIDPQRVAAAANAAGLDELIASLPNGLAERIGEHGVRLSGGERQQLGIARALYRDSPVLVLDEATSALDARSEANVVRLLQGLKGRKTIILVAHRLVTVHSCDVIFELEHGQLVRRGTYEQLLRTSALFRHGLVASATAHE